MNQNAETKTSELKETLSLLKDVGKHFVLEGRRELANGLNTVADKVDITKEQASFINQVHQKLANRKKEKEARNAQPVTA